MNHDAIQEFGKIGRIFDTAHRLFMEQGYEKTTIRQISRDAGVSLGLTNHFYRSKWELAFKVLNMLFGFTRGHVEPVVDPVAEPLLFTIVYTQVSFRFLFGGPYRLFYTDCLEHDIFFRSLDEGENTSIYRIAERYNVPVDDDLFLLYSKYVPYNYEKILVLNKRKGLFPSIGYDEIPDYIIRAKLEPFLARAVIDEAIARAWRHSEAILADYPQKLPEEHIERYLRNEIIPTGA